MNLTKLLKIRKELNRQSELNRISYRVVRSYENLARIVEHQKYVRRNDSKIYIARHEIQRIKQKMSIKNLIN
jgi:hypothetical protein